MMEELELRKLYAKVYTYPTKNKEGFTSDELLELKSQYPTLNESKFDRALIGITGLIIKNEMIVYHCDVYNALRCGIENRTLTAQEWD